MASIMDEAIDRAFSDSSPSSIDSGAGGSEALNNHLPSTMHALNIPRNHATSNCDCRYCFNGCDHPSEEEDNDDPTYQFSLLGPANLPPVPVRDLEARDSSAIQYSKSRLDEGDTLIIINYPNNGKAYDATGFEINTRHIVHSEKLLATGSSFFKSKLEDEWGQHKVKRRFGLIGAGTLPPGVKYVLNLTPPEEGDEALKLTSNLSCSEGMLLWRKAVTRCGVAHTLIGGQDETTSPPDTRENDDDGKKVEKDVPATVPLDYDPIRHRTGIERLLQIIENKEPRLDSAPKIWTLAVLAEYFDCRTTVMDYIFTWVWADPNCRIIEILPESILRLGMTLENAILTRASFSILVSEEALDVGTRVHNPGPKVPRGFGKSVTKFGRVIERLEENHTNMVEYAGAAFAARVDGVFTNLVDPEMKWLWALDSWAPLMSSAANTAPLWTVNELMHNLTHYVRGSILSCLMARLTGQQTNRANEHRIMENWKGEPRTHFAEIYDSLEEKERIMTRYFWEILRNMDWKILYHAIENGFKITNITRDWKTTSPPFHGKQDEFANKHGVDEVWLSAVIEGAKALNLQVSNSIGSPGSNNVYVSTGTMTQHSVEVSTEASDSSSSKLPKYPLVDLSDEASGATLLKPARYPLIDLSDEAPDSSSKLPRYKWIDHVSVADGRKFCDVVMAGASSKRPASDWKATDDDWLFSSEAIPMSIVNNKDKEKKKNAPSVTFSDFFPESRNLPTTSKAATTTTPLPENFPTTTSEDFFKAYHSGPKATHQITTHAQKPAPVLEGPQYFSPTDFFKEVSEHITTICNQMLNTSESDNEWSTTCDTLLCLSEDERKYLPLYAGGLDDDSGGVFADPIPEAEKGPIGPGPAFHTGSTRASSLADWDGMSDAYTESQMTGGVETSLGVEDGFSASHVDRRNVVSEDEFPQRFDLPIRGGPTQCKGKEASTSDDDSIMSDAFMNTPDETEDEFEYEEDLYGVSSDEDDGYTTDKGV